MHHNEVKGAIHLFEKPEKIIEVANLTAIIHKTFGPIKEVQLKTPLKISIEGFFIRIRTIHLRRKSAI
jgi:hypothetical protein